ncbi:MAG: OmpA family protein [Devosiaceae bacterium]|nr:OmpA family protein [Devosiaceae bacterium MH13]
MKPSELLSRPHRRPIGFAAGLIAICILPSALRAEDAPERVDLMTFAQGVLPVSIAASADFRTDMAHAIAAIDGNTTKFVMTPRFGTAADSLEIVYALPAPTSFDRFAVPEIRETPSPSQTFFRQVEVFGSADSVEGPFTLLASGTLEAHAERGAVTELTMSENTLGVSWIKLRFSDGLDVQVENTFFEFTEVIGNGVQATMPLSTGFSGVWDGRGVDIELAQQGATVTGCYDTRSALAGTVDGQILRALGADDAGVPSQFILIVNDEGALRGLRSTNGAPFKVYDGEMSGAEPVCLASEAPTLGCGDTVYGIGFDFDSAVIRAESAAVLDDLYAGLTADGASSVQIIGHSSSEGADGYNRDLSERRAASVVEALVERGFDPGRMQALGKGEDDPIASNADEAGRSLNRRVEVICG